MPTAQVVHALMSFAKPATRNRVPRTVTGESGRPGLPARRAVNRMAPTYILEGFGTGPEIQLIPIRWTTPEMPFSATGKVTLITQDVKASIVLDLAFCRVGVIGLRAR